MRRLPPLVLAAVLVGACQGTTVGPVTPAPSPIGSSATPTTLASVQPASPTPPSTPAPSPAYGEATPPATIDAAGLIDTQHGWVVLGPHLLLTADGGTSWRDVTPPPGLGTAGAENDFLGAAFLDPLHGWVALNEPFTSPADPSYGRVDIWRTTDGGQHWAKTQLPKARFAIFGEVMPAVQFDFLDATHGFAFQSGDVAKGANDSDLFYTSDGGATWSADRPTGTGHQGIEGTVAFANPSDGVIVDALHGRGTVVTHDGGRTWSDAIFPLPTGASLGQVYFDHPVFFDSQTGLVAVKFQGASATTARIYRTTDAGSSWTSAATLPAGYFAVAIISPERWIAFSLGSVVRTADGGAIWSQPATSDPPNGYSSGPQFADGTTGWWLGSQGASSPTLLATTDGGVTWYALTPGISATTPTP